MPARSREITTQRPVLGLTTWKNAPQGKILKPDVVVAKNYLTEKELKALDRIVTMYLDYAEDQAERKIPMTMLDGADKLNAFLKFNEPDILDHPGKVSQESLPAKKTFRSRHTSSRLQSHLPSATLRGDEQTVLHHDRH
jgi:hypothetical protein